MAAERQPPDAVLASSNYSSIPLASIDEDPDSPDGLWGAWDGNGNTSVRTSFPTPSGDPTVGADLQEFRVQIRKSSSGGFSTDWSLQLWENGVLDSTLATGTTTSTTGEVVSGTWNASSLGTADGSLVELVLEQTDGGSGSPGNRRGIEVGAVEWNVTYDIPSVTVTDVDTDEIVQDGETDVTITGTVFESVKGSGKVELGDNSDYATATKVEQTTQAWADTEITCTIDLGGLASGSLWIFVTNDSAQLNDPGFAVTVNPKDGAKTLNNYHSVSVGGGFYTTDRIF